MRLVIIAAALAVVACSSDVRDTKIADIDFTDAASVQQVAQKLDPGERKAFVGYAVSRTLLPGMEVVGRDGRQPSTVREAISLAQARSNLMNQRNALVERRNALIDTGLTDRTRPGWERLGREVDDYDKRLAELQAK